MNTRHRRVSFFSIAFCLFSHLFSADLTTDQQVEMGLAALRGATGMYNSYTFINKPSQFKRSEIVAKLSSIAHDSMNIYNTHGTEHYRLQQSLRLVHDACSLCYVLLNVDVANKTDTGVEEAMHVTLQALHYALPALQSGGAQLAATKTGSNAPEDLKAHRIAQTTISLCHFINDALKAPNNPNLLYTRLSLCAASLGLLTYELKNINTDERQDKDKIGNADKKTNTNNNKETKDGSANIESSDSESEEEADDGRSNKNKKTRNNQSGSTSNKAAPLYNKNSQSSARLSWGKDKQPAAPHTRQRSGLSYERFDATKFLYTGPGSYTRTTQGATADEDDFSAVNHFIRQIAQRRVLEENFDYFRALNNSQINLHELIKNWIAALQQIIINSQSITLHLLVSDRIQALQICASKIAAVNQKIETAIDPRNSATIFRTDFEQGAETVRDALSTINGNIDLLKDYLKTLLSKTPAENTESIAEFRQALNTVENVHKLFRFFMQDYVAWINNAL